jgi:hypothetical protein
MFKLFKPIIVFILSFLTAINLSAQNRLISGTVADDTGEPLAGASVVVDGTSRGTTADADGKPDHDQRHYLGAR